MELAQQSDRLDVQFEFLKMGDYIINGKVVIERKGYADLAVSVVDGRLFRQAAALTRSRQRTLLMVEGPVPPEMPNVHPHSLKGAILSLAVSWRVPVVFSKSPEESLRIILMLAEQSQFVGEVATPRFGYKPRWIFANTRVPSNSPCYSANSKSSKLTFTSFSPSVQIDSIPIARTRLSSTNCIRNAQDAHLHQKVEFLSKPEHFRYNPFQFRG